MHFLRSKRRFLRARIYTRERVCAHTHTKSRPQDESGLKLLCVKSADSTRHTCERQPCHSLVSSCVNLEGTQRKENCCAACNSKHQRVLQSIVAGIRGARLARLRDNRVGGGVGICVDKTIADVNGINNRDVLLALVDLDLEGNDERVARSNVLCPGYGARSWVVGAVIISGAINVGCVL